MEKEKVMKPHVDDHDHDQIHLPPGFRFHPSDEELIVHYLSKKTSNQPIPAAIFAEVELYKFNPWDLPMKASSYTEEEEWYFFTPRERKYPNGMRPNRMTSSGYWKATGTDKPIISSYSSKVIGLKKALVFYLGRPPKGNKTHWLMQEYRLPESTQTTTSSIKPKTTRLDDWVLCRVWRKTGAPCPLSEDRNGLISREPAQACTRLGKQCSKKLGEERTVTLSDFPTLPFLMDFQNPCSNINVADVSSLRFEDKKISTDNPGMYSAAAVSNISFEGIKATSSVCEDNFNIEDYHGLIEMTRTLVSNTSTTIDGNSQDIGVGNIYKKNPVGPEEVEKDSKSSIVVVVPQQSESNDTNGAVSCSTRQVDKNDSISPLDQLLMSPDLYSWTWAFP